MRPRVPSLCDLCEYYVPGVDPSNDRDKPVCRAFPQGIPSEILDGGFDHREPLGNESIVFKLAQGATQEDVERWEQEVLGVEKGEMLGVLDQVRPTDS